MADDEVIGILTEEQVALGVAAYRDLIPEWPAWIREVRASDIVDYTRFGGHHYSVVMSGPRAPEGASSPWEPRVWLYATTVTLLSTSSRQLLAEPEPGWEDRQRRARDLRRGLPTVLSRFDLSGFFRDGELDAYDRKHEGSRLRRKAYYRWDEVWDHDHCVFCGAKFSLDDPDALTAGYAVQGGPHGDDYHWICGPCLDARRGLVHYVVEVERPEDHLQASP